MSGRIRPQLRYEEARQQELARRAAGRLIELDEHGYVWLTEGGDMCEAHPVAISPWATVLSLEVRTYVTMVFLSAGSPVSRGPAGTLWVLEGHPHVIYALEDVESIQDALRRQEAWAGRRACESEERPLT